MCINTKIANFLPPLHIPRSHDKPRCTKSEGGKEEDITSTEVAVPRHCAVILGLLIREVISESIEVVWREFEM